MLVRKLTKHGRNHKKGVKAKWSLGFLKVVGLKHTADSTDSIIMIDEEKDCKMKSKVGQTVWKHLKHTQLKFSLREKKKQEAS